MHALLAKPALLARAFARFPTYLDPASATTDVTS
jgi:hypothetical protein